MKFGIFYELQLPRPWQKDSELRLYQDALTQVEVADRVGYDYAWMVEHHFLEEYSHCPAPESFLGAASQRTKNIRLGHGIFQVTTNHPTRVAERVAVLDLLSNGRCEFGMGESASITELEPFGRTMEDKRAVFDEAVAAIFPMFKDGAQRASRQVFRYTLPRTCSPSRCRSRTRRSGWRARSSTPSSGPGAAAWARSASSSSARMRRTPGCTPTTTPSPSGSKKLADYTINPNIALVSFFMCCKTDEEARKRADGCTFFQFALRFYGASADRKRPEPGTVNMWDEYNKWKRANPDAQEAALRGGLIGSPDTLRKKLAKFETSHIDQVILLNQAGKNAHEDICESLELFGKEVMPEFQGHHAAHEAWKAKVMRREIELEEIETTAFKDRYGAKAMPAQVRTPKAATG